MNNTYGAFHRRKPPFRSTAVIIVCMAAVFSLCNRQSAVQWRTVPIERGDLSVEVTSSGTANPHTLVQVGTQVSGTIAKIFVDFNAHVKNGQLIALLDTTFLHAALEDAAASLNKAQTEVDLNGHTATRTKALFDKGLAAQADLDQALADYASAKASLSSAQAGLDRAKINIAYAYIRSPITGVVVNRNVDVGQTVAASFNTPTLFTIADDLSKMQVQASIDEADIGQIKLNENAQFSVDAYPDRSFSGIVTQIRLQPTTLQNVVSYTVMIDVDNADLAIMPGMTANLTVAVKQAHNVLKVPLAALKFNPPKQQKGGDSATAGRRSNQGTGVASQADSSEGRALAQRSGDSSAVSDSGKRMRRHQRDSSAGGHGAWSARHGGGDSTSGGSLTHRNATGGGSADSAKGGAPAFPMRKKDRGRIFVLENGKPVAVPVKIGLSNGGFVSVEGDIHEGQQVIVAALSSSSKSAPPSSLGPMGGGATPGGMSRRF